MGLHIKTLQPISILFISYRVYTFYLRNAILFLHFGKKG